MEGNNNGGVNYWDTYSRVISWFSICILMIISKLNNLYTKSADLFEAYPRAKLKSTIFLRSPQELNLQTTKKRWTLSWSATYMDWRTQDEDSKGISVMESRNGIDPDRERSMHLCERYGHFRVCEWLHHNILNQVWWWQNIPRPWKASI